MYLVNLVCYAFCLLFSLAALLWIIPAHCPPDMGMGIAPSFFPNVLACTMGIASAIGLFKTWRSKDGRNEGSPINLRIVLKCIPYIAVIGISFPLMRLVGFIPGGIVIMTAFMLLLGERRLLWLAGVSVGVVSLYYVVFWHGMKIMLP